MSLLSRDWPQQETKAFANSILFNKKTQLKWNGGTLTEECCGWRKGVAVGDLSRVGFVGVRLVFTCIRKFKLRTTTNRTAKHGSERNSRIHIHEQQSTVSIAQAKDVSLQFVFGVLHGGPNLRSILASGKAPSRPCRSC